MGHRHQAHVTLHSVPVVSNYMSTVPHIFSRWLFITLVVLCLEMETLCQQIYYKICIK